MLLTSRYSRLAGDEMKEVNELVDWVFGKLEMYTAAFIAHTEGHITTEEFGLYLLDTPKQILSHPNLYYKDHDIEVSGLDELHKAFILLAEAIKGMK